MSVTKQKSEPKAETDLRVAFETLGCRSNFADTVELQAAVTEQGGTPCNFDSQADVYVLNTCTVTDNADKTTLKTLKQIRSKAPEARIVVTGCMAETGKDLIAEAGLGDVIVGPGQRTKVLDAILSGDISPERSDSGELAKVYPDGRRAKKSSAKFKSISLDHEFPAALSGPAEFLGEIANRSRYHLRVQEGCENSCTFCIIPQTRGRLSSRSIEDLLADIRKLSGLGYREVVLTGTHLGGYGVDSGSSLYELLSKVAEQHLASETLPRVRLSSIDPNDLDLKTVQLILGTPEVFCNHLHICVQAFDEQVLKRMNRLYGLSEALELIDAIAELSPDCGLGSDVICGFPGESREQTEKAMELFGTLPFNYLHVFPYSEREGTAATRLPEVIDYSERKRRAGRWRSLASEQRTKFLENRVGKRVELVVEKVSKEWVEGTTREFVGVKLDRNQFADIRSGELLRARGVSVNRAQEKLLCEL